MVPDLYLGFKMIMFMCFGSVSVEKAAWGAVNQPDSAQRWFSLLSDEGVAAQVHLQGFSCGSSQFQTQTVLLHTDSM